MSIPKIKPCPRCGNAELDLYGYGDFGTTWHVECSQCHYMGPGDNKRMAVVRHNELSEAAIANLAATITRLTAERDEARAECERHLLMVIALVDAAGGQIDVYPDDMIDAPRQMLERMEVVATGAVRFRTKPAAKEPGRGA